MSYSVKCQCSRVLTVRASQAGTTLQCVCGADVEVPSTSALRKAAGEAGIPRTTIGQIRAMIQSGELPKGEICPLSTRPADMVAYLRVQCERVWVRGGDSMNWAKAIGCFLMFGWATAFLISEQSKPVEEMGRDTSVDLPVRISSESYARFLKLRGQKQLRQLLDGIPIYQQLLQEYPDARISVLASVRSR